MPKQDLAELMRQAVEALDHLGKAVAGQDALPSDMVVLAESVSTARRELYAGLIHSGWIAPGGVLAGIRVDEELVAQHLGRAYDRDAS
ncbi:MAG: hypothetical protein M3N21_05005 [Actinomycetota bacterium]|nr:hypothetical protein [Actinomycetota bacterium]